MTDMGAAEVEIRFQHREIQGCLCRMDEIQGCLFRMDEIQGGLCLCTIRRALLGRVVEHKI